MGGRVAPPVGCLALAYRPVVSDVNQYVIGATNVLSSLNADEVASVCALVDVLKTNVSSVASEVVSQLWVCLDQIFNLAALPSVANLLATACVAPSITLISGSSTRYILQSVVDDVLNLFNCSLHNLSALPGLGV